MHFSSATARARYRAMRSVAAGRTSAGRLGSSASNANTNCKRLLLFFL
jgi:hypothetical protein